jgi:exopolysaccharide biosynthesis protein
MLNKKRFTAGLLTALLAFNTFITFSSAEFIDIYGEESSENLSRGVVHEKILRFTHKGWLNINVLRIDTDDNYTSLEVLTSKNGISNRDSLTNLASESENAHKVVGAINGDFYDTRAFATIGPVVKDGELITSSKSHPDFATFNIDDKNKPFIDYWQEGSIRLINGKNSSVLNIAYKNKPYINTGGILLDSNWGELSFGNEMHDDIVEMVIVDNRVQEIRDNLEAIEIPDNGFIIAATGEVKAHILNNFSQNDRVLLNMTGKPNFEELSLAMGGGSIILKDGIIPDDFSLKISGNHPRTGLGISKDKDEIIMVTIDGRTSSYTGTTQRELAEILIELGAYDGINLDGGGSTEMVVKPLGDETVTITNNPSGGFERKIMNGLAVLNNSPKSQLKDIKIECDDTNIFLGTSRKFRVKAYDGNYNPAHVDLDDVIWRVNGIEGDFMEDKFIPTTTGEGTIEVSFKNKTASIDIQVLEHPNKLHISPSKIFAEAEREVPLYIEAVNDEGFKAKINSDDLIWSIPNKIGDIENNTFISSKEVSNDIIKASLNNIDAYIQVSTNYLKVIFDDFERLNAGFLPYPKEVVGNFELSPSPKNGQSSGKLSYDFTDVNASKAAYIVFNDGGLQLKEKPEKLGLWVYGNKGNGHWLRGKITDSAENSYNITFERNVDWEGWKFVEAIIPNRAIAPIKLERIYLVETEPLFMDSGYIYVDDITAFYKPSFDKEIPKDTTVYIDKRNISSELKNEDSFRFLAHGSIGDIDTMLDTWFVNELADITETMDLNLFTNHIDGKLENQLLDNYLVGASGYSHTQFKNSSFIRLDNSERGLRATDYNQWIWLLDKVKNLESDSLFVVLPKPLSFIDKLEEKLFFDTLGKLRKEKNMDIWILSGGNNKDFEIETIKGIGLVKLKSFPTYDEIDPEKDLKYMVFTVNDGYVTYEIKNMFKKDR